jgi:hypothetical protein
MAEMIIVIVVLNALLINLLIYWLRTRFKNCDNQDNSNMDNKKQEPFRWFSSSSYKSRYCD